MTSTIENRVTVEEGVVFGSGGGRDLHCDIYRPPAGIAKDTGVLLIHGGGWRDGDRTQLKGFGILLGRVGYPCVATEYRLTPEAPWPAQVHDVKACLRWMKANAASLGIDPAKIVAEGNSAGAHLALILAGTPNVPEFEGNGGNPGVDTGVAAAIAVYAPTDLVKSLGEATDALFKGTDDKETRRAASPLTYANAGHPPTLLVHGNADEVVPASHSLRMYEGLEQAGVPVELHMYARQPHAFDSDPNLGRHVASTMESFIRRFVG